MCRVRPAGRAVPRRRPAGRRAAAAGAARPVDVDDAVGYALAARRAQAPRHRRDSTSIDAPCNWAVGYSRMYHGRRGSSHFWQAAHRFGSEKKVDASGRPT